MGEPLSDPAARDLGVADADQARRLLEAIEALVTEYHGPRRAPGAVTLDSALERELGLDSLARVELAMRIERAFGRRLSDEALATAETPRDLMRALARAPAAAPGAMPSPELAAPAVPASGAGLPHGARTLLEVLQWHAVENRDRTHITLLEPEGQPQEISYGVLRDEAARVGAGLQALGIEPGQSVALMLPTSREFFVAFFGVIFAGAVPVPIYPPLRWAQVADHMRRQSAILASAQARALITVPEAKPLALLIRGSVETLRHVVTVSDLAGSDASLQPVARGADDIAFLQYTSGSTGAPKGVILTHANLLANIRAMGRAADAGADDVFVSWLPLYHDMGLIGAWFGSLYFAMRLVVMSPLAFLARPVRWLQAIHLYRGTFSAAPNFAYEIAATRLGDADLEGLDLSCWRWAFNGAEPVSVDSMARFAQRFAPYGFDPQSLAPVYGLAECTLDLAFPPARRGVLVDAIDRRRLARDGLAVPVAAADPQPLRLPACGRALPGYEIRIAAPNGRELPEREQGRVEFRGPSATSGYFRNSEATRTLFDGDWLDSGDLGYLADGELYLTGRAKDMMIRGGQNLYPYELEEAVGDVPGIRKGCVAVFSVSSERDESERIVVVAETREGDEARRAALRAAIDDLAVQILGGPADEIVLAPPHTVLKTSSGKIRRAATREVFQRGLVGARPQAVWRQLAGLAIGGAAGRARQSVRAARATAFAVRAWTLLVALGAAAVACTLILRGAARRRTVRAIARGYVRGSGLRVSIDGRDRLPESGPAVLVANHASYLDGILLYALLPASFQFVAKEALARRAWTRWAFRALGVRFVERFDVQRGVEDTRELATLVRAGAALAFFPEGTFRRMPGLLPFRMGAFVIGAETGAPVTTLTFRGTRNVLPDGAWRPRPGLISVVVGTRIMPGEDGWGGALRLRDAARAQILRHCGEPDLERAN